MPSSDQQLHLNDAARNVPAALSAAADALPQAPIPAVRGEKRTAALVLDLLRQNPEVVVGLRAKYSAPWNEIEIEMLRKGDPRGEVRGDTLVLYLHQQRAAVEGYLKRLAPKTDSPTTGRSREDRALQAAISVERFSIANSRAAPLPRELMTEAIQGFLALVEGEKSQRAFFFDQIGDEVIRRFRNYDSDPAAGLRAFITRLAGPGESNLVIEECVRAAVKNLLQNSRPDLREGHYRAAEKTVQHELRTLSKLDFAQFEKLHEKIWDSFSALVVAARYAPRGRTDQSAQQFTEYVLTMYEAVRRNCIAAFCDGLEHGDKALCGRAAAELQLARKRYNTGELPLQARFLMTDQRSEAHSIDLMWSALASGFEMSQRGWESSKREIDEPFPNRLARIETQLPAVLEFLATAGTPEGSLPAEIVAFVSDVRELWFLEDPRGRNFALNYFPSLAADLPDAPHRRAVRGVSLLFAIEELWQCGGIDPFGVVISDPRVLLRSLTSLTAGGLCYQMLGPILAACENGTSAELVPLLERFESLFKIHTDNRLKVTIDDPSLMEDCLVTARVMVKSRSIFEAAERGDLEAVAADLAALDDPRLDSKRQKDETGRRAAQMKLLADKIAPALTRGIAAAASSGSLGQLVLVDRIVALLPNHSASTGLRLELTPRLEDAYNGFDGFVTAVIDEPLQSANAVPGTEIPADIRQNVAVDFEVISELLDEAKAKDRERSSVFLKRLTDRFDRAVALIRQYTPEDPPVAS